MNKTITLIDLLDMDAEGEEIPSKVKFEDNTYKLKDYGYEAENGDCLYGMINYDGSNLNETIEIIEDNDKLEKINNFTSNVGRIDDSNIEEYIHKLFEQQTTLYFKINKIINHINKIEEKLDE